MMAPEDKERPGQVAGAPHEQPPEWDVRGVPRFIVVERVAHWLYALLFLIALVSGLLTWIPSTRARLGGARHGVELRHALTGFAMIVVPLLILLVVNRRRLLEDVRQIDRWSAADRRWFWAALRGGTLRRQEMPPQGKFNAGQKVNAVLVAAIAVGLAITGGFLLAKASLPAWLVSRALWLHSFLAVVAIALFLGHLGHVFLTRHGWGYLGAMVKGRLPVDIARERHRSWWEKTGR
jgi:formate dehydrogenase subunit gamma